MGMFEQCRGFMRGIGPIVELPADACVHICSVKRGCYY